MKNILKLVIACVITFFVAACDTDESADTKALLTKSLSSNRVYFFYQTTCPHCHYANEYISQKYPDLKMIKLDIRSRSNASLFLKCADKFKLNHNALGTPLICMGDHYILGWSDADKAKFDSYVQKFK